MRLWVRDRCKSCGAVLGSDDNRWNCPMMRGLVTQRKRAWRRPKTGYWRRPSEPQPPNRFQSMRIVGDDFGA